MHKTWTPDAELNPVQAQAANSTEGPLLILAGAGSGKTRVLTYRVANIIAKRLAMPQQILAVTFTNKAAREMESRIVQLLERISIPVLEPLWINTFHSICAKILRSQIHLLGYPEHFVIYDDSDQLNMVKKVMTALNINDKIHPGKSFKHRINEAKNLGMGPEEVLNARLMDEQSAKVYQEYEKQMKQAHALDFGDLLLKTHEVFQMYPEVLAQYQQMFKYILVDEYQDTNRIQYMLMKSLASAHHNICVVGDEDQSIYSWRGADITNILNFEKDFPSAQVVKLEQNYRSTKIIVEAASALIKNNSQRKDKTLFTSNALGNKILVHEELNEYEEARYVVRQIEAHMRDNPWSYKDFAVFYRMNSQSRVMEDLLRSHGVPYKIIGGMRFYERKEVKDILSYLRLVLNSNDDMAFDRIINVPSRGIGKTTLEKIEELAHRQECSYFQALMFVVNQKLVHGGGQRKLLEFYELIGSLQNARDSLSISDLFKRILDQTQYVQRLKEEGTAEAETRVQNLEEMSNAISQFESERGNEATLQSFLEEMALVSDADAYEAQDNFVTLMTLHISKGLEFPNVFIIGMEDGMFPGVQSIESQDPFEMEEERRLAYVGITRARKNLFLTHARSRRVWGQERSHPPSRFIQEIPEAYLKLESSIQRPKLSDSYSKPTSFSGPRSNYQSEWRAASAPVDSVPKYEDFTDDETLYSKGMRVRHPVFGVGSIHSVEGSGKDLKVSVLFNGNKIKKFVARFARLERA